MNLRRAAWVLAGVLWFSVAASARSRQPGASRAPATPGSVAGTVTSATTGRPVAGAWVVLRVVGAMPAGASGYVSVHTISTDRDGRFEVQDVAPGLYSLQLGHPGYVTEFYKPSSPGADQDFNIRPGERLDVKVELVRAGNINGRVTDKAGNPLPFAAVNAWRVVRIEERLGIGRGVDLPVGIVILGRKPAGSSG